MAEDWANLLAGVDLHLDVTGDGGRRHNLERALREAVRSGRLNPDTRLPATRALAAELGIARNTVAAAYDQLIAEGFLRARVGAGTYVAAMPEAAHRHPPLIGNRTAAGSVTAGLRPGGPPPPRYDLRPGRPDVTTFPTAAWLRAGRRALNAAHPSAFDYGDPRGRVELRVALAEYLGRTRGVLATPEQILVTSGYVQALSLLTRVLAGSGRAAIAMEDPGLPYHRSIVERHGGRVVSVPVDDRGAVTELMGREPAAVVLTPAHQYPTGVTLHPSRRHAAVRWAQTGNRYIIEDDYDAEFRFDRQPVGALQAMAPDHVVYVGTASKTLGPALRLAWAVLPDPLIEPMIMAKQHADSVTESLGQLTLAELITSHEYDRHVRACRLRYRRRRDLLVERLGREYELYGIAAGMHAMIKLPPDGPSEVDIMGAADAAGLGMDFLDSHWHRSGAYEGLIVGYGTPRASAYPAAVDVLARLLRARRRA